MQLLYSVNVVYVQNYSVLPVWLFKCDDDCGIYDFFFLLNFDTRGLNSHEGNFVVLFRII